VYPEAQAGVQTQRSGGGGGFVVVVLTWTWWSLWMFMLWGSGEVVVVVALVRINLEQVELKEFAMPVGAEQIRSQENVLRFGYISQSCSTLWQQL